MIKTQRSFNVNRKRFDQSQKHFDLDQRVGDTFIKRPAFRSGTIFSPKLSPVKPDFPVQKRALDRDGRLRRKSFKLTGPSPRISKTIEEIEALKTKQQGIKFRLGPGQFGEVRVAKRDKDGKLMRDEEGNIIFELKEFDLSMVSLPLQDRLELLQDSLLKGLVGNMNNIGLILASIFRNSEDVKNLSSSNLRMLHQILTKADSRGRSLGEELPASLHPWDDTAFSDILEQRFITKDIWNDPSSGMKEKVSAFLLKNIGINPKLTAIKPLFGVGEKAMALASLDSQINVGNDKVFDLGSRRLFRDQAEADMLSGDRKSIIDKASIISTTAAIDDDEAKHDEFDPTIESTEELSRNILNIDPSDPDALRSLTSAVLGQSSPIQSRSSQFRPLTPLLTPTPIPIPIPSSTDTSPPGTPPGFLKRGFSRLTGFFGDTPSSSRR